MLNYDSSTSLQFRSQQNFTRPGTSISSVGISLCLTKDELCRLRETTLDWLSTRVRGDEIMSKGREWKFLTRQARLFLDKHGPSFFNNPSSGRLLWENGFPDHQQRLIKCITMIMDCQIFNKLDTERRRKSRQQHNEMIEDQTDEESEAGSCTTRDTDEDQNYVPSIKASEKSSLKYRWTRGNAQPGMRILPSVEGPLSDEETLVTMQARDRTERRNLLDIEATKSVRGSLSVAAQISNASIPEKSKPVTVLGENFTCTERAAEMSRLHDPGMPGRSQAALSTEERRPTTEPLEIFETLSALFRTPTGTSSRSRILSNCAQVSKDDCFRKQLDANANVRSAEHHGSQNLMHSRTRSGLHTPPDSNSEQFSVSERNDDLKLDSRIVPPPPPAPRSSSLTTSSNTFPLHLGGDQFKLINRGFSTEVLQNVIDFFRSCEEECQRGARQASEIEQRRVFEFNRVFLRGKLQDLYGKAEIWSNETVDDHESTIVIS